MWVFIDGPLFKTCFRRVMQRKRMVGVGWVNHYIVSPLRNDLLVSDCRFHPERAVDNDQRPSPARGC